MLDAQVVYIVVGGSEGTQKDLFKLIKLWPTHQRIRLVCGSFTIWFISPGNCPSRRCRTYWLSLR